MKILLLKNQCKYLRIGYFFSNLMIANEINNIVVSMMKNLIILLERNETNDSFCNNEPHIILL